MALELLLAWLTLAAAAFVREGPYRAAAPRFDWKFAATIWRDRPVVLANLGYFGHMWELYAMWTVAPLLAAGVVHNLGWQRAGATSLLAFAVIGVFRDPSPWVGVWLVV